MPAGTSTFWGCWSGWVHHVKSSSTSTKQQWGLLLSMLALCGIQYDSYEPHWWTIRLDRVGSAKSTQHHQARPRVWTATGCCGAWNAPCTPRETGSCLLSEDAGPWIYYKLHHLPPEACRLTYGLRHSCKYAGQRPNTQSQEQPYSLWHVYLYFTVMTFMAHSTIIIMSFYCDYSTFGLQDL